jgi:acyl carrier protein
VLGLADVELVGPDKSFRDLGFDSLGIVELRNQLNAVTGLKLTSTLVFDHPTPVDLAEHLLEQIVGDSGSGAQASDEESEIRAWLGSLSLAQLRQAGVLDAFAPGSRHSTADSSTTGGEPGESIETMDADDLILAALGGPSDLSPGKWS